MRYRIERLAWRDMYAVLLLNDERTEVMDKLLFMDYMEALNYVSHRTKMDATADQIKVVK